MDETKPINDMIKHKRRQELCESLAAMRTAEKSDVILTCADREFYAHKSVLEASSPYFVTMFRCGLEETKSGKVHFQDMDPEALGLILDYLYLGEVDKIQTIEQLRKVLESSHLMQLEHLVEYCYDALIERLSLENFVDIWNIADKFGSTKMLTKLFNFLMVAISEVLYSPLFTCLSFEQLKAFLSFTSEMVNFCDEFLVAIVSWLRKDLQERAKYAKELFECADAKLLSKNTIKMLLEDEELMNSSEEIRNGLKDIGIAVAYFTPRSSSVATQLETLINAKLGQIRIVFHTEYQLYLESNCISAIVALTNRVQEFDPSTMSWLSPIMLPSRMPASVISGQNYITLQDDILRTITCSYIFNSLVLFTGQQPVTSFQYLNRMYNVWEEIRKPNCALASRMVFASSKYMYIVGISETNDDLVIEFTVLQYLAELDWYILPPPQIPEHAETHFFVYKDKLCAFYYTKGELVKLMFDHKHGKWLTKVLPIGPPGITDVACIYRGSPDECIVFVSTAKEAPLIPNFIWEPETGKWIRLPPPKGKCELEDTEHLRKLCRMCPQQQGQ